MVLLTIDNEVKYMKLNSVFLFLFLVFNVPSLQALSMSFSWVEPERALRQGEVVIIAKVISAKLIGGETVVSDVRVIEPLKGAQSGQVVSIYHGPEEVGAKYLLLLSSTDSNIADYELWRGPNTKIKVGSLESEYHQLFKEFIESKYVKGEAAKSPMGFYYLPSSCSLSESECQKEFDFVQIILKNSVQPTLMIPR